MALSRLELRVFFLATLLALCCFLPWLPSTVQYGDSGELVGNAIALRISHPPGFPLFHWLYHFWLALPLPLTPYHQAALLTAVLFASAIGVIVFRLRPLLALPLALLLAASEVSLRQALLPDVFALHALLVAVTAQAALGSEPTAKRWWVFCIAFALACANHPSAVFLAPLGFAFLRNDISWKQFWLGLGALAGIVAALYASLLLFSTAAPFAWPVRPGLAGLLHHLLRADYGTLQLSAAQSQASWQANLGHLLEHSFPLWLALAPALVLGGQQVWLVCRGQLLGWVALALYLCLFYSAANIAPEGFGGFVLERFHVLPLMLLAVLLAGAFRANKKPVIAALLLVLLAMTAGIRSLPRNQWQRDSVLEDLALNLRNLAEKDGGPCVVILASGDSHWGAWNYLQSSQPSPVVTFAAKGLLTIEAYQASLERQGLRVIRQATESGATFDVERDLLAPNLGRCRFYALDPYSGNAGQEVTILPLGRRIASGSGTHISREGLEFIHFRALPPATPEYYSLAKKNFAYYAEWPLALGLEAASQGKNAEALAWFEKAHKLVPYLAPPVADQCTVLERMGRDTAACQVALQKIRENEFPYLL